MCLRRYAWRVAEFGKKTLRQRLRAAVQRVRSGATSGKPADCTPWVLGGLWPPELTEVNAETALVAEYLKNDLQRIADSANARLRAIADADYDDRLRKLEEARVVNVARAFAVLRVESTVRQLRREPLAFQPEFLRLPGPHRPSIGQPATEHDAAAPPADTARHRRDQHASTEVEVEAEADVSEVSDVPDGSVADPPAHAEPVSFRPAAQPQPAAIGPLQYERTANGPAHWPNPAMQAVTEIAAGDFPSGEMVGASARPASTEHRRPPESGERRLKHLVHFVARQEPGLRWAVGLRDDGTTVVATDLAHGWILPGIRIPEGVVLLAPQRRTGNAVAMLGEIASSATYTPGDPFGSFGARESTEVSTTARRLDEIDDLTGRLVEVTHGRAGLPRLTHALVGTVARGGVVVEGELDVLRVHLDTARYQLLANYPQSDRGLLLNCLLLAAAEGLTTGDEVGANYHFAWFEALAGTP